MMKLFISISFFILLMVSCHSSEDELLNMPFGEEVITVANETFKVDFNFDDVCKQYDIFNVLPDEFAKLKTKNDLLNYYKTLSPGFLPSYSSMWRDNGELVFVRVEYMLAQECFSDRCDSKFRKEVLRLAINHQKAKYKEYTYPCCAQKSGVFLMAVILIKEKNSTKIIDQAILQKALLCLSDGMPVSEEFSQLIIEYSEYFLINNKQ